MDKIWKFIRLTLLGGFTVILPLVALYAVFHWLYELAIGVIAPFADLLIPASVTTPWLIDALSVIAVLILSFAVGLMVQTSFGRWFNRVIEKNIWSKIPGYQIIKESIQQLIGKSKTSFKSVAMVRLYDSWILATALIAERHANGSITVFVPSGPNPTTGYIYHIPADRVFELDVPIEKAMRSIISGGIGSDIMIEAFNRLYPELGEKVKQSSS